MISELNERSRLVFRYIVDTYLSSGEPVGSRTISKHAGLYLSPASIRNTMADLEGAGLLYAPHTSAGRMPTEIGLRLYIDGLMQVGNLTAPERAQIEAVCNTSDRAIDDVLSEASNLLSGLSACASLVIAPKQAGSVRQIQFVQLSPTKILTILVFQSGLVENRVIESDQPLPPTALIAAANYLNARLSGRTFKDAENEIRREMLENRTQLDTITQSLVEKGLALHPNAATTGRIIIRGQSKLLEDVRAISDLERARQLLGYLEEQQNMLNLLGSLDSAEGVQIFIGTQNKIFDQSGWSMIIAPYKDSRDQIVGALGVIGPTRLDYDRIIPMVDYTSQVVSKIVEGL